MENRKVYLDKHTNLLQLEEHMYPLVDVTHRMCSGTCFIMMRFRRLRLMIVLYRTVCRMRSGSRIRHSGMDSSREHPIQRIRL